MPGLVIASHQAAAVQKMIRRTIMTRQDWRERISRAERCSSQSWTTLVGNVTWRGQSGGMAGTFRGTGSGKSVWVTKLFFGSNELFGFINWMIDGCPLMRVFSINVSEISGLIKVLPCITITVRLSRIPNGGADQTGPCSSVLTPAWRGMSEVGK